MTLTASGLIHAIVLEMRYASTYKRSGCYDNNCTIDISGRVGLDGEIYLDVTHGKIMTTLPNVKDAGKEYIAWAQSLHPTADVVE